MKKSILILVVVAGLFTACNTPSGEYACQCESAAYTQYGVGPQYVTSGSTKAGDPNFDNARDECIQSAECDWIQVQ